MIKIKEASNEKRNAYVALNGIGTIMFSTDSAEEMQKWYNDNYRSALAWSYSYCFYDDAGIMHEVEIDET